MVEVDPMVAHSNLKKILRVRLVELTIEEVLRPDPINIRLGSPCPEPCS